MIRKQSSKHMAAKRTKLKCMTLIWSLTLLMLLQVVFNVDAEAVFTIRPAITLSEEYDDNLYLTRENKVSDFITRAMPSISMSYRAPFWDWTFDYTLNWSHYAKLGESRDSHNATLISKTRLIQNFLYLDLNDTYSSVVIDPRQPSTETNLVANRTDTNNLLVSPYIRYQLNPSVVLSVGYRYVNIWYREAAGINRQMHTGFAAADYMLTPQVTASLNAEYSIDRPERLEPDNDQTAVFLKVLYKMDARTDVDASLGYRWVKFDVRAAGHSVDRPIYDAGLIYRISETGRIEVRIGSTFTTSPNLGVLERRTEQVTVRYGEALSVNSSLFHRRDVYFETDREDEVYGVTAGLEYRPFQRLMLRAGGRYEKDRFLPEDEERTILNGSAGVEYQLTPKATLILTYNHTRENGRTPELDFKNNVVAVQVRMAF